MTSDLSPVAEKPGQQAAGPRLPRALGRRIGFLLAKTHLAARERANEALSPLRLDVREYASLVVLASEGSLSQQSLAELQRCDRTTMVAIVDHLEEAGLVKRRRNPQDRRAYALEITPGGRAALERANGLVADAERAFLAPLSAAERAELTDLLQRLLVA